MLLITACAHTPKKEETIEDGPVSGEDLVSVRAALNHAQMSYLKGCAEAYKDMKIPQAFETCKGKALYHRKEIENVLTQPVLAPQKLP